MNKEWQEIYDPPGEEIIEILPDRLFWVSASYVPRSDQETYYFSVENMLQHRRVNYEEGPLDIQHCSFYLHKLHEILTHPRYKPATIFHYTGRKKALKANAALLMGVFMLARLGMTAEEFANRFAKVTFKKFRDASFEADGEQSSWVSVQACLCGIEKAMQLGWLDFDRYDFDLYRKLNSQEHYFTTFLIPDKLVLLGDLLLFEKNHELAKNIDEFATAMRGRGLELLFRFNQQNYKSIAFRKKGIKFYEMHRPDSVIPCEEDIQEFLRLAGQTRGVVGLQCKDGMGVSAFMAALFMIENYQFEVDSLVGLIRMIRPGALLTVHHEYLRKKYRDVFYFPYGRLEALPVMEGSSPTRSRRLKEQAG